MNLAELSPEVKLRISKCIYEEASLKKAATRFKRENPKLDANVTLLEVYSRSPEHWANVTIIRSDILEHIENHPYVPGLDRLRQLIGNLEEAQERLNTIPKDNIAFFVRLSAEIRALLVQIAVEAQAFGPEADGTDDQLSAIGQYLEDAENQAKFKALVNLSEN